MSLVELVIEVHRALEGAGLPHAFGGALALAYVTEPRGTIDVDVNVFVPIDDLDRVLGVLGGVGLQPEQTAHEWMPMAGIRLRRPTGTSAVDVFLSLDESYQAIRGRCISRPFGPNEVSLPFLSAEDLALFKLSFGRDKDWVDLRAMVRSRPVLDIDAIGRRLVALRGPMMHPRVARLRVLLREESG